ncbi:hypothetical protein [Peribacillus frigoritolerans]|uniref:hypothetical protein n=1 Tax=Peribacillus frigoritolerans TaxID=450367 RepID=UPI0020BDE8F2|nr:hypothetical protein [Peribacillus frigoritolerans]
MKKALTGISFFLFFLSLLVFVLIISGAAGKMDIMGGNSFYLVMSTPFIGLILSFFAQKGKVKNISIALNALATVFSGIILVAVTVLSSYD